MRYIDAITSILRLKNETKLTWGEEQQEAFEKIYLSSPPMLKAPRREVPFRLYAETRYTFTEKLCLSLYYVCTKLRHYLLSSTCIVVCQTDVLKHMLQKPILSGRIDKWAYALVEYDLTCEPLKSMKGQIVADFIVERRINDEHNLEVGYITCTPQKLYGSICDEGQGIGVALISLIGAIFEFSN